MPVLGALLLLMDRVEDWLTAEPGAPRHARTRRHLKLIHGGGRAEPQASSPHGHRDAA
ncbi:hypothetical protein ACYF6T_31355 [Streptomyces sp. 7R007]